jgi:hypothetical protein
MTRTSCAHAPLAVTNDKVATAAIINRFICNPSFFPARYPGAMTTPAKKLQLPRRNQFHAPLPRVSAQGMTRA